MMTDDTISRQAALDALRTCYDTETITYTNGNEYIDYDQALDLINNLPSAQQWIPCSERLPEVNERCLCTYEFNEGTCVDFGLYTKRGWFVSGVTAWMSLPEPYKEERSE